MPTSRREDLFESTKMSFGEHLDELRVSLFKAVIALAIGVAIGFYYAESVILYIQTPLKASLVTFYEQKGIEKLALQLALDVNREEASEEDIEKATAIIEANGLLYEARYLSVPEVLDALSGKHPEIRKQFPEYASKTSVVGTPSKQDLVPIYLYYPSEEDPRVRVIALSVIESFMMYVKAALMVGIVVSSPLVFYFIWQFVAAGLYPHEKKYVYLFMPFSILLFIGGATLAFFGVLKLVIDFLFTFNGAMGIDPDPRIQEWVSFVLLMPIGFGIAFQLPLVMLFLNRIGIFTIENYISKWRMSILVIAILSAVLTPADPTSMVALFIPLTFLYFGGILLCKYLPNRKSPFADELD